MALAERVIDVLLAVTDAHAPVSAADVAGTVALPLSTTYRHLSLLKRYDLIVDLGRDAGFTAGPGCARLARSFDSTSSLIAAALPEMRGLGSRTQESIGLMRPVGAEVLCVEMVESPLSLRCSFGKGRSQPLTRGASAKALLAFMGSAQRDAVLDHLVGSDEDERACLMEELETIRGQGHAESESELDLGVWGVSAPVFSATGQMEGSISLMAPTVRVRGRRETYIEDTVRTAAKISDVLAAGHTATGLQLQRKGE